MADDLNTSFFERRLKIVIQLYKGEFEDGSNTKEITDLAMTCQIQKLALPEGGKASAEITGLPLSDMEQLTTLALILCTLKTTRSQFTPGTGAA